MASMTSGCCASTASPNFCVQSSFELIMERTDGVATSDFTLSSQPCLSASCLSRSSCMSLCSISQRSACTISSGYVDAINTCASNVSGYSATGATSASSCSDLSNC